jgi:hypothetical protein
MNFKFIISLSMFVALTGAPCWGAAESDEQMAQRLNYKELDKLFRGDFSKISRDIFEEEIVKKMSAATLMNLAVARPKLYPYIKTIPQFRLLQQNMGVKLPDAYDELLESLFGRRKAFVYRRQELLFKAAQDKYPGVIDVVDYLIQNGANINEPENRHGLTPLMYAIPVNNRAIVELLLTKGADINAQNIVGTTALWGAVANNNSAMVELLLAKGANVNVTHKDGSTLLNVAERNLTKNLEDEDYQNRARAIVDLLIKELEHANGLDEDELLNGNFICNGHPRFDTLPINITPIAPPLSPQPSLPVPSVNDVCEPSPSRCIEHTQKSCCNVS